MSSPVSSSLLPSSALRSSSRRRARNSSSGPISLFRSYFGWTHKPIGNKLFLGFQLIFLLFVGSYLIERGRHFSSEICAFPLSTWLIGSGVSVLLFVGAAIFSVALALRYPEISRADALLVLAFLFILLDFLFACVWFIVGQAWLFSSHAAEPIIEPGPGMKNNPNNEGKLSTGGSISRLFSLFEFSSVRSFSDSSSNSAIPEDSKSCSEPLWHFAFWLSIGLWMVIVIQVGISLWFWLSPRCFAVWSRTEFSAAPNNEIPLEESLADEESIEEQSRILENIRREQGNIVM